MENFKKAMKQAILDKAEAVRFEEGQAPCLMLFSSESPLAQLDVMDSEAVRALIDGLIPAGIPLGETGREGVLSIVNFGELHLLAQLTYPCRLFAFIPPQGNHLFQQIRSQLLLPMKANVVKPINLPVDDPSDGDDRGQFAIGGVTEYGSIPSSLQHKALPGVEKEAEPEVPAFAGFPDSISSLRPVMPMPPVSTFAETAVKPMIAVAPQPEFEAMPSEINLLANFNESNASLPGPMTSIRSHEVAESEELEDYHYLPKSDLAPPEAMPFRVPEAPRGEIHFGAHIPGETIERNGHFAIDPLLAEMVKRKASDLHLTMGEPLCMRIDGDIVRAGNDRIGESYMRDLLLPIIPPKNREEFSKISDTDFAYEVPGLARFRVNIFRDRMGVGAVLRQIPDRVLSADDLGLAPAIRKFCELQKGLVVVTGPTGSGKSTTLAGMVDLINESRTDHILTIEDPIEFVHKQKRCLLNQREVHKHTQSFSRALRAALREDPDIILIGEMRDLETVAIAIETAETGHLVFGTLHTNTAISTIDRLIDQFSADQQEQIRVMLAESLKGVVAQTLVKKKGGGRVAAHEILVIDKAVSSLIREGNTHMVQNHMQTQKAKGNITLNDSLLNLVVKGIVDARDAYMKAVEKEAFAAALQAKGISVEGVKSAS